MKQHTSLALSCQRNKGRSICKNKNYELALVLWNNVCADKTTSASMHAKTCTVPHGAHASRWCPSSPSALPGQPPSMHCRGCTSQQTERKSVAAPKVSFCLWLGGAVDRAGEMWTTENISLAEGKEQPLWGQEVAAACMITGCLDPCAL